jgi:hypothetical protein
VLPDSLISITEKLHGTSAIASYILCNKKLSLKDRIAKWFGANIIESEFDYIYSSRKVIKNKYICDSPEGFYSEDIWKTGFEELKPFMQKGMSIYYEIVGYLNSGKAIQSKFDYGCSPCQHEKYIYRITTTNEDGKVFEWSMLQIQQWCKANGLKAVPLHYYGYTQEIFDKLWLRYYGDKEKYQKIIRKYGIKEYDGGLFLDLLQKEYLEKKCIMCKNDVPNEGIVLRLESLDIEPFKLKSHNFRLLETQSLDKQELNIEDNQEQEAL